MNPYLRGPLRLTADDRAAWRRYEALARAAAEQYRLLPTSLHRAKSGAPCAGRCGKRTSNPGGKCRSCRKGTS